MEANKQKENDNDITFETRSMCKTKLSTYCMSASDTEELDTYFKF